MDWKKLNIKELERFIKYNKSGLTQKQISDKLGVSKNTLMYSIRQEVIKLSIFQDLCEILHTNPCLFFKLSDREENNEKPEGGQAFNSKEHIQVQVYEDMKRQMQNEINHLRKINVGLMNLKQSTVKKEKV